MENVEPEPSTAVAKNDLKLVEEESEVSPKQQTVTKERPSPSFSRPAHSSNKKSNNATSITHHHKRIVSHQVASKSGQQARSRYDQSPKIHQEEQFAQRSNETTPNKSKNNAANNDQSDNKNKTVISPKNTKAERQRKEEEESKAADGMAPFKSGDTKINSNELQLSANNGAASKNSN